MGNTTIDGVEVDQWRSCMYWGEDHDNFTLDYFFTRPGWAAGDRYSPSIIPLRAELKGIKNYGGGVTVNLHHIYEYLNLRVYASLMEEDFSLPSGMQCNDSQHVKTKPIPELPTAMFYTDEIVVENTILGVDVYYDEDLMLVRQDRVEFSTVDDFNTGMRYEIDQERGSCDLLSLSEGFDVQTNQDLMAIKGPQELFLLKGNFTYTGIALNRGFRCDQWSRILMGQGSKATHIDVFFANPRTTIPLKPSAIKGHVVAVVTKQELSVVEHNIMGMRAYPRYKVDPFDISICKEEKAIKELRIEFSGSNLENLTRSVGKAFMHQSIAKAVVKAANVSPIQVTWTEIRVVANGSALHWYASLLAPETEAFQRNVQKNFSLSLDQAWDNLQRGVDSPLKIEFKIPSKIQTTILTSKHLSDIKADSNLVQSQDSDLSQFHKLNNKVPKNFVSQESIIVDTEIECAKLCLNRISYQCTSYFFCPLNKKCQLSKYDNLSKAPTDVRIGCSTNVRDYLVGFKKAPGLTSVPKNPPLFSDVGSASRCAKKCIDETSFTCQSLVYCATPQLCSLGDTHYNVSAVSSAVSSKSNCSFYSRNDLLDYNKSPSVTFNNINKGDYKLVLIDGDSPQQCAQACSSDVDNCHRFSYCASNLQCILDTDISGQTPSLVRQDGCDIYSMAENAWRQKQGNQESRTGQDSGSYSDGSMAGLAVGILVVTIVLVIGIVLLLAKRGIWNGFKIVI
ncbi:uncharacterized protein LOC101845964 [Aplysia californica]|uniref:Uncharacterized protein LOC101845964 n=1 Tax=Aplysia californica TaxID=6500 RepID=A0ABM0JA70_APLCA|nr:uncharacterized protein LOC101845964 [Aplysia californica]